MSLPFPPACAPLLLGSLPHRSPAVALELSRRYAGELLAWPQLWQRSFREQMLPQGAAGFPGLVFDNNHQAVYVAANAAAQELGLFELAYLEDKRSFVQLGEREAAGLFELLRQHDAVKAARAVKGQTLGPISLAMQLTDEQQRPLIYDPVLFDAVSQFVRMRASWQDQRLAELDRPTIICLDEPYLEMIGSPFLPLDWREAQAHINLALGDVQGCRAIYAGGAIDWGHLLQLHADLVAGDVYDHGGLLVGAVEHLAEFLAEGNIIGFGILPADEEELAAITSGELLIRMQRLIQELASAGIATETLLQQAVILPNSALGELSEAEAEHALQVLAETSTMLRKTYRLS